LRRSGQLPAVVYGKDTESLAIQVEAKAFDTLYRAAGRTSLVKLHVDGSAKSAIIREVQRHPLSRRALHVDFLVVDLLQEMEVDVPLVFTGEPPAVELTGGTLMTPIGHLRVRALPAEIPHEITVDVTPLVDLAASGPGVLARALSDFRSVSNALEGNTHQTGAAKRECPYAGPRLARRQRDQAAQQDQGSDGGRQHADECEHAPALTPRAAELRHPRPARRRFRTPRSRTSCCRSRCC